jgi:hypothetical protein
MSVSVSLGRVRVLLTIVWLVHESEYDFALALVGGSDGGPESSKDFIGWSSLADYGVI